MSQLSFVPFYRSKEAIRRVVPVLFSIAVLGLLVTGRAIEAQPATVRFEETSPALSRTGAWSRNGRPANSGGSAVLSMDAGARATFVFTGSSVRWIGHRDEWSGLAEVFLDGARQTTVDTFAAPAHSQATLYSARGLRDGEHTLTIEVKGSHSATSSGSWVWIDSFLVTDATPSLPAAPFDPRRPRSGVHSVTPSARPPRDDAQRGPRGFPGSHFEQDDPSVTWSGAWSENRLAVHSGNGARLSMEASDRVDFAFTGTGVRWLGYGDEWSGIADVFLDGRRDATVDTYSAPARAQVEFYAAAGLRDGPHTLTIRPTGRRRPASGGAWIWVDAFSIEGRASPGEKERGR